MLEKSCEDLLLVGGPIIKRRKLGNGGTLMGRTHVTPQPFMTV